MSMQQEKKRRIKVEQTNFGLDFPEGDRSQNAGVSKEEIDSADSEENSALKNDDGDSYFDLSTKRRCTIRKFKGSVLIDIREVRKSPSSVLNSRALDATLNLQYVSIFAASQMYEKDGKAMPGKKGISLNLEQYNTLKKAIVKGYIDKEIEKL
jgi:hypothetical protein